MKMRRASHPPHFPCGSPSELCLTGSSRFDELPVRREGPRNHVGLRLDNLDPHRSSPRRSASVPSTGRGASRHVRT